jgi:hypothetical protein
MPSLFLPRAGAVSFEVKHLFHSASSVHFPVSLFDLESSFLAPTHTCETPARAGVVKIGRRSNLVPCSTVARPHLYGAEHAGVLMVVGMMFEGSPLSGTRSSRRNLVSGGSS